jgi:hypothetical protein
MRLDRLAYPWNYIFLIGGASSYSWRFTLETALFFILFLCLLCVDLGIPGLGFSLLPTSAFPARTPVLVPAQLFMSQEQSNFNHFNCDSPLLGIQNCWLGLAVSWIEVLLGGCSRFRWCFLTWFSASPSRVWTSLMVQWLVLNFGKVSLTLGGSTVLQLLWISLLGPTLPCIFYMGSQASSHMIMGIHTTVVNIP